MTPTETKHFATGFAFGLAVCIAMVYIMGCNPADTDTQPVAVRKVMNQLPAPEMIGMSSIDGRMTFSCTEVEGAEGYAFQAQWSGGQVVAEYTGRPFASFNSLSGQTIKVRAAAIDSNGEYGDISLFSREYTPPAWGKVERKSE